MFKVFMFIKNFSFCRDIANLIVVFKNCLAQNLHLKIHKIRSPRAASVL